MTKKKRKRILSIAAIITAGTIVALVSQKEKNMNFDEISKRFEQAVEEVLGKNIQPISKTEVVRTLTYANKTDKDANIYYRILQTTYYKIDAYEFVTGLNTDALNVLFPIEQMDTCIEMMVQNSPGALYKENDTAFLCWTHDPEVTFVLEYTPSKTPDSEILKMAESVSTQN